MQVGVQTVNLPTRPIRAPWDAEGAPGFRLYHTGRAGNNPQVGRTVRGGAATWGGKGHPGGGT